MNWINLIFFYFDSSLNQNIILSVVSHDTLIVVLLTECRFSNQTDKDIGRSIVHINKPRKWLKVTHLGLGGLRHQKWCLSRQARYRLTLVPEGDTVGELVRWLGDVGRQVEVGTPIRITRRTIARHRVIRLYYCVVQYSGYLKTERYDFKQVVLLSSLTSLYQVGCFEDKQKYGGWEVSGGSSIFSRSKDEWVGDGPLPSPSTNHNFVNKRFNNL